MPPSLAHSHSSSLSATDPHQYTHPPRYTLTQSLRAAFEPRLSSLESTAAAAAERISAVDAAITRAAAAVTALVRYVCNISWFLLLHIYTVLFRCSPATVKNIK
jgi:hypothetical protein